MFPVVGCILVYSIATRKMLSRKKFTALLCLETALYFAAFAFHGPTSADVIVQSAIGCDLMVWVWSMVQLFRFQYCSTYASLLARFERVVDEPLDVFEPLAGEDASDPLRRNLVKTDPASNNSQLLLGVDTERPTSNDRTSREAMRREHQTAEKRAIMQEMVSTERGFIIYLTIVASILSGLSGIILTRRSLSVVT